MDDQMDEDNGTALNLNWVVGLDYKIPNGVHNLSNDHRDKIFYASAHTGVIYDYKNRS
jgi:hypothetical protein